LSNSHFQPPPPAAACAHPRTKNEFPCTSLHAAPPLVSVKTATPPSRYFREQPPPLTSATHLKNDVVVRQPVVHREHQFRAPHHGHRAAGEPVPHNGRAILSRNARHRAPTPPEPPETPLGRRTARTCLLQQGERRPPHSHHRHHGRHYRPHRRLRRRTAAAAARRPVARRRVDAQHAPERAHQASSVASDGLLQIYG